MSEDRQLVDRVIAGDAQAADAFARLHKNYLYSILTRVMELRRDEADEVFTQFFVHLWEDDHRRLRKWTGRGSLKSYLAVVLRRLALDFLRKKSPFEGEPEDDPPEDGPGPDRLAEIGELRRLIHAVMKELSENDRRVLEMVDIEGLTYREVSERNGMTVSGVGVALMRARARLLAALRRRAPDLLASGWTDG